MPTNDTSPYDSLTYENVLSKQVELEQASASKLAGFDALLARKAHAKDTQSSTLAGAYGLDPDSVLGTVTNAVGTGISGLSNFAGGVGVAPYGIELAARGLSLEEKDYVTYNKYNALQKKIATGAKVTDADKLTLEEYAHYNKIAPSFEKMKELESNISMVNSAFDNRYLTDTYARQDFQYTLANDPDAIKEVNAIATGNWEGAGDGVGYLGFAKSLGTLARTAVSASMDNPEAVIGYMIENAPQIIAGGSGTSGKIILGAFTSGYAGEYYNKSLQAYREKYGKEADESERANLLTVAASMGAAEYAASVLTGGMAKLSPASTGVQAAESAGVLGLRASLKAGSTAVGKNIADVVLKTTGGFAEEAATEGYQTGAEQYLMQQEIDPMQVYEGAAIGGVSSAGTIAPMATLNVLTGNSEQALANRRARIASQREVAEAVKSGNADIFLDEASPRYDLGKGVSVLHAVALDTTKTPEERATASKRAQDIVENLASQLEADTALLDSLSIAAATTPELMQSSRDILIAKMEEAAAAIPAGEALSADAQALLTKRTKHLAIIDKAIEALSTSEVQEAQARVTESSKQIADLKPMAEELKKQRIEGLLKTEEEGLVLKRGTSKDVADLNLRAEKEAQDKLQEVEARISDLERSIAASTDPEHISALESMLQQNKEAKVEAENSLAWKQEASKKDIPDVMIKPTDPNYTKFKASAAALAKAEQASSVAWEAKQKDGSDANVKAWEATEDVVQEAKTKHRTLTDMILAEKAKGTGTSTAPKAASQGLIIRSVIRTNNMTPEEAETMANDTTNDLNEAERSYLRKFSAARIAENELQTLESVDAGIFVDSGNGGHRSIEDYYTAIALAIAENNTQKLQALMSGLRRWAESHSNKYRLMKAAFATVQKYEKAQQVVILKETDGSWRFATRKEDSEFFPDDNKIFKKDKNGNIYKDNKAAKAEYARVDDLIKEGGHITVSKGSGKYVAYVGTEAVALRTAYSELSAAVSATTEGITVVAIPEASTQSQTQATPISATASAATPMASQEAQEAPVEVAATQAPVVANTPVEQAPASKTPVFDTLPAYVPGQKTMIYAGVGSRKTPPNVMAKMTEIAAWLSKQGYTLRSGHAEGADTAFENGAGEQKEIFTYKDATETTRAIAKEIHPKPSALGKFAIDLMARNTNQVFGENLDSPVDFVLVWTPDGAVSTETRSIKTGGTGQAIDMASRKGIPVINMANKGWGDEFRKVLKIPPRTASVSSTIEQAPEVSEAKPIPTQVGLPIGTIVTQPMLNALSYLMAGRTQPNYRDNALDTLEKLIPQVLSTVLPKGKASSLEELTTARTIFSALYLQAYKVGVDNTVTEKTPPAVTPEPVSSIPVRKDMPTPTKADTVEAFNGLEDDVVQEDIQEDSTEPTIEVTEMPEVEDVFLLPDATSLSIEEAQKIIASHPILKRAMEHIEFKLATDAIPSGAVKFSVVPAVKTNLEKPTEGYYYEVDGQKKIVLFVNNIKANKSQSATDRLVWVAFHEITHRGVAELALGKEFMTMLKRAAGNDYVKAIANAIYEQRQLLDSKYHVTMEVATEEALSELSAAFATNNLKYLEETYDVVIPAKEEVKTNSWVREAIGQVKAFYAELTGKELTLAQTRRLLLDATRAGIYGKDTQNDTLRVLQEGQSFLSGKIIQEAGNGETVKPLASIADFFTTWKNTPELTQWLVTEKELSSEQDSALLVLKATIEEWMPLIEGMLKTYTEDFAYARPYLGMFLREVDDEGKITAMTLEENVKAAIAYALYTYIRDEGGVTRYLEDENINLLLNRSKYDAVTSEERGKYGYIGHGREMVIAKLSKTIADVLGLQANKNNEQSLLARLEYGLGSIAYGLAIKTNTLSEHSVFIGDADTASENTVARNFARFPNVRLYNPEVQPAHLTAANEKNKTIVVSGQGSQSIVAKLMGVEYRQNEPTLKPSVTTVNDVKSGFAETPDKLVEINNKENEVKNYIDSKMYTLLLSLGGDTAIKIMGYQDEVDGNGKSILQKTERVGVIAANESILRNWNNAVAFVDKTLKGDFMLPFFLKQIPWGPQRVGIEQNVLNPNADKMARWLLTRAGWKSVIKFSEPQEVDSFVIVVAAALNIDIDKESHKTALGKIKATLGWKEYVTPAGIQYKVENQDYATVIQAIMDQQYNEVGIPTETQQLMLKLVGDAKTNMHALKALVALAEFMYRQNVGDTEFTTDLTAEVDGVNNGPMLTQLMWGTFPNAKFMEKGGFFGINTDHKDFNVWKEATKENDLYQHTSQKMGEVLVRVKNYDTEGKARTSASVEHQDTLINAFYVFTKELVEEKTQQVTSAARKLIKTPVTQYHFGSAAKTASNNVFYSILDGVYQQAKAVGNDPVKSSALRRTLNTLIADKSLEIPIPTKEDIRDFWLNKFELTSKQKAAIKKSYDATIGAAVEGALEETFSDMAITRDVITAATNTAFYMYDTTFQFFRKQILASTGNRELTRAEETALHEKLKPMFPKVATWFSNNSDNGEDSQLPMMKGTKRETSTDKAYRTSVDFNPGLTREDGKDINTANGFGQQRVMDAPAVLLVSEPIHSSDSGGSHLSIEGTEALNNHDANLTSVFDLIHRAKALNKSIFKVTLEYSPVREILKGYMRTMTELEGILDAMPAEESAALLKAIHARLLDPDPKNPKVKSLEEQKIPFVTEHLAHITKLLSDRANTADIEKLKFYKATGYISQYAFEGGSYQLTEKDHEAIDIALNAATVQAQTPPTDHMSLLEKMAKVTGEDVAIDTATLEKDTLAKLKEIFSKYSKLDILVAVNNALLFDSDNGALLSLRTAITNPSKSKFSKYLPALKIAAYMKVMQHLSTQGIWGRVQPRMPTALEAALSALTDNSSAGLVQVLKGNLSKSNNDRLSVDFQRALLSKLESLLPKFTVVYLTESITRDSVPKGVMEDEANAQMVIDHGKYTLYIRGHDYVNGGVTSLEVIHELLHSVLTASLMEPKNKRQIAFKAEILALFEIAKANDKDGTWGERIFNQADEALALDEFIAYALTDQNFQRLLESIVLPAKKTAWSQFVHGVLTFLGLETKQDTLLAAVIGTVASELEARTLTTDRVAKVTAIRSHTPSPASLRDYTTEDVFDSLDTGTLESTFKSHLKGILNGMVDVFYGPFGIFGKERMEQQPISPLDVFAKAKVEGRMPFVSDIIASGFTVSEQEQFVAEQIEWVVRAALVDNEGHTTTVYTQLARMYKEAETKYPTPESFLDNWATASPQEQEQATRLHESLFKLEMGQGKSNHIARFAAIVLGVKEANDKFKYASKNRDNTFDKNTISGKLLSWLNALLEMFESKMANTFIGQQADEKLLALVDGLVAIEAKKLHRLQAKRRNPSDMIEDGANYLTDKVKEGIYSVATSKWVKENKNDFIGAAGAVTAVIAGERVDQMLDMAAKLRDKALKQKYGLIMGLLNEARGAVDSTVQFFGLNRITKFLETQRKDTITRTANHILDSMGLKKDFTKDETEALTYYGLRSGMYTLLPLGLARIEQIMSSESELKDEMDKTIAELMALGKYSNWFIQGAMKLGYSLMTDQAKGVATMTNAFSVASGDGTLYLGKIPNSTRDAAIPLIDKLATLQAIKSGKKDKGQQKMGHRDLFAKMLREQMAREDKINGIEFLLLTHKKLHEQAQNTLFKGSPRAIPKAYLPEVTNPHVDVIVANEADGKQLLAAMYVKGREIVRSKYDTSGAGTMHVYVAKGGGMKPWLSGIFSFSNFGVKSKAIASEDMVYTERKLEVDLQMKAEHAEVTRIMTTPYTGFDPEKVQGNYQFPLINTAGQVAKYEYRMDAMTRDTLLERDNRFHTLLGTLDGNMYDKETATVQNIKAVQALYDFYQANKVGNMDSFALISPLSPDPELRAIADMMTPETREAISKIWGSKGMYVPYNLLDINFGYRKPSIVAGLFKDAQAKKAYAEVITNIFTTFITRSNDEEDRAAARERARRWLTNQGDIWAELVAETKDFIVVKSGITLLHNVTSNFLELVALGMNPMTILKHHRVAIKGILQHERDSKRLAELEHWVTVGFTQGKEAAMRREIVVLRDALLGNPVDKLLKAGLMPTIVEDVSQSEDIYSHKSDLTQWVEGKMKKVNPKVRTVLRTVYMTKDSTLYRGLSTATQYSDFIARYTLYQHEISKKKNPLTHEQAVQSVSDAFINYDIPSHRKVQWANDVGLVMFTKYYIRIQKVILKIMKENPIRGLAMMLLNNYWDALPMLFDSGFLADSYGGGLFHTGAFELPGTLDGILTARVAGTVF